MSSYLFLAPLAALGIFFMPVYLLRRQTGARAQDFFVSSGVTEHKVIANASIAYALKIAMFVPLFGWGASGDLWPAVIMATSLVLGLYLIGILRRPLLEFLDVALGCDRSITISEFVARQHGNDRRVRLLAAALTLVALTGLILVEALGFAALLKPVLSGDAATADLAVAGVLVATAAYTVLAGNSGVMHAAQLQLGILYLALFGATAFLLYLQASELRPVPPHGTLAVLFIAAIGVIMPFYRRVRYMDTGPIDGIAAPADGVAPARKGFGVRSLRTLQKTLNVTICVFSGLAAGLAILELYSEGLPVIAENIGTALRPATTLTGLAMAALFLQPLFYQIVDVTNWQRIAAFEKDLYQGGAGAVWRAAAFNRLWRLYAAESPLMWLFLCMFGAVAVVSTGVPGVPGVPGGPGAIGEFVTQLVAQPDLIAATALSLLLVGVLAMALSTTSSLFSAGLAVIRCDALPALRSGPAAVPSPPSAMTPGPHAADAGDGEGEGRRLVIMTGVGLGAVIVAAFYLADTFFPVRLTGTSFIAWVFALSSLQLAFVPLVLGPMIGRSDSGFGAVSPGWALTVLACAASAGVAAVGIYCATGREAWLWSSVPACLGLGAMLFALARIWREKAAGPA